MTQEGFTVGLIRVGDNIKKYKLIDFRGRDEVKKDKNRNRFNLLIFKIFFEFPRLNWLGQRYISIITIY